MVRSAKYLIDNIMLWYIDYHWSYWISDNESSYVILLNLFYVSASLESDICDFLVYYTPN